MEMHNILVVDDEDLVLKVLSRQLAASGYPVHTARNGREGLIALECFDVSVVISDHLMPDMTGLEFLREVRRRHPRVVRVMLTGHAELDMAIECINNGEVFRLLVKPWEHNHLMATVKMSIEKYVLGKLSARLLENNQRENKLLAELERHHPGLTKVDRQADGSVVLT